MKSIKYMLRNITRNKLRSFLTILSMGFSLALMTVLYGYLAMQNQMGSQKSDRIVVMSSQGFMAALPIASVERVRSMPSIAAAVPYSWFGGKYKDQQMAFSQFGTDPKYVFDVWTDYKIDPDQLREFQRDRQACVADRRLAERMGWQLGERIPLQGEIYQFDLDLKLVGLFDSPMTTDSIMFNLKYLDEGLQAAKSAAAGNAGSIFAKVADPKASASASKAIDTYFENSDNPTKTQTEAAFIQVFADMVGNVKAFIFYIGLAVVFSLTLVAATAMAMSMRERTTEIAVLKAIGFSNSRVLWLVLGESCMIAMVGGLLGIGIGCMCLQALHSLSEQFFPFSVLDLAGRWLVMLLATAAGIGFFSGIVPAVNASKLSVVNGLRRVV